MWSYIAGLLLGLVLLFLLLFFSVALSSGFGSAVVFMAVIGRAALRYFQGLSRGIGLYAVAFIILAAWVWNFGKKKQIDPNAKEPSNGPPCYADTGKSKEQGETTQSAAGKP